MTVAELPRDDDDFDATVDLGGADEEWSDGNDLDLIRRELREKVDKGTTRISVPVRAGWEVEYTLQVNAAKMTQWEERARKRRGPNNNGEVDHYRLAVLVCANLCVNIWRRGKPLNLTFRDPELHELLGLDSASTHRARDAVVAFYGGPDASLDIIWVYSKWSEATGRGWDDFGDPPPDPT
jgi:hypothetical protein